MIPQQGNSIVTAARIHKVNTKEESDEVMLVLKSVAAVGMKELW